MHGIQCSADDLWTVAQTCYGEARDEGSAVIYAVAWVVRNRREHHRRWQGRTFASICRAAYQFSCWDPGEANRRLLREVSLTDRGFVLCLQAAVEVLGGVVAPSAGRATHYYADTRDVPPQWATGSPVAVIGHHLFFEGID